MGRLVGDLIAETEARLSRAAPRSAAAVRAQGHALAAFSESMAGEIVSLKAFLFAHMYRHPQVMAPAKKAQGVVEKLFTALSADPGLLPPDWAALCGAPGDAVTGGVVRDYIAGMTDRYALEEYGRIFHTKIEL
jgi:dGTPase